MNSIPQFQVYGLYDPRTQELRYIGITTLRLHRRLTTHVSSAKNPNTSEYNNHRSRWIRTLLSDGIAPDIRLIKACATADEMYQTERDLIARGRQTGVRLTNHSDGGDAGGPPAGSPGARRVGDKLGKLYIGFIDPSGRHIIIENMKRFCEEHGLVRKSMMDVYEGRHLSHHGYRHVNTIGLEPRNIQLWTRFIRPDGTYEPPFLGLREFCERNNLHRSRVSDLIEGKCKSYKGWRYQPE